MKDFNVSRSLPECAASPATSGSEPSAPECPFCEEEFEVMDARPGTVWGHCDRCREMVTVDVEFSL